MTSLLHISDPHFGTDQPPVAQALVRMAREQRPEVLVLSGDITQRAHAAQFRRAREFCDSLGIPHMVALPGNHDIPLMDMYQRLFKPYGRYLREFGPGLEPRLDMPWLQLTTVKTTRRWRHKNGEVSAEQIEDVVKRLRKAHALQLRVVVVHQPVHVLRSEDEHDRLRGWEPAVRAWAAAGADMVMGGHIHLPYVCEMSHALGGLTRRIWCVQAGTALSSRVRQEAPNSVNLLHYGAAGQPLQCRVERWDYRIAGGAGQFALAHTSEMLADRG
ncbi:MAG: metallophosphoesterase [Polaromonas sp.]|nr:metallophosphoesterase [Polaromonas sp.]